IKDDIHVSHSPFLGGLMLDLVNLVQIAESGLNMVIQVGFDLLFSGLRPVAVTTIVSLIHQFHFDRSHHPIEEPLEETEREQERNARESDHQIWPNFDNTH